MPHDGVVSAVSLLDRPLYGVGQAARLLHLPSPDTLRRWLDGYSRAGKEYPPVIRERSTGNDVMTWGEFVEARYLAEFRNKGVSLQHLRVIVDRLREEYRTPYPLAHAKPFHDDVDVVMRLQEQSDLPDALRLVVVRNGQLVLSSSSKSFVSKVVYAQDLARKLRPAGVASPVVIDPLRSYGMPSLEGRNLRTENIVELYEAGESAEAIAEAYDLTVGQVDAAVRFELGASRYAYAAG